MTDPWFADDLVTVYHGDSLDILKELPDASIDAVVTDPPYGLEFMGKEWDRFQSTGSSSLMHSPKDEGRTFTNDSGHMWDNTKSLPRFPGAGLPFQSWCNEWATECLRVLKPGGHMLAFGGTRTWHRLACAIEDAGFEVRDSIAWLYGSGFPKSLDVSKAIDKAAGAERVVVGFDESKARPNKENFAKRTDRQPTSAAAEGWKDNGATITAPATADAQKWAGWGTALKPAHEPIVVARKPLVGTVASNVLAHGTGALNVDACRIGYQSDADRKKNDVAEPGMRDSRSVFGGGYRAESNAAGRWPANVVLDPAAAAELDRQSGERPGGNYPEQRSAAVDTGFGRGQPTEGGPRSMGDSGGASRFFYVAKANTAERPRVARDGAGEGRVIDDTIKRCGDCGNQSVDSNGLTCGHTNVEYVKVQRREEHVAHPTVKPLSLMRWLVRLVTPKGGVVLDPFLGSGTTAEACVIEGFRCVGVERESDYLPLIRARLTKPIQPDLFG